MVKHVGIGSPAPLLGDKPSHNCTKGTRIGERVKKDTKKREGREGAGKEKRKMGNG